MAETGTKRKKIRLQFDFTQEQIDDLELLKRRIDAGSKAEVVRRMIRLTLRATKGKSDVIVRDRSGKETIVFI